MARGNGDHDTAERILDIASRLVQTRGFNGFSYADIAAELGMTKASLHYHFPTKVELGRKLIERYERSFVAALQAIEGDAADEFDMLRRYAQIYAGVLADGQMCLCGMLAAEHGTLPEPMRGELTHYFDVNEAWLSGVLERGRAARVLRFEGTPIEMARVLVASLEGAMMLARSYGDPSRFSAAAERLLGELRTFPASGAAKPRAAGARAVKRRAAAGTARARTARAR
jgi:TetR/AcrR family transcriptional repressor of nem operon